MTSGHMHPTQHKIVVLHGTKTMSLIIKNSNFVL